MGVIIVALAAGIALGASRLLPAARLGSLGRLITATLFIMLVALGAQIGANRELLANIGPLGWRAFVISVLSVAGSVAALYIVARHIRLTAGAPERRDG
ncbi:LysO family transporter [Anaeroselena agilis]|uniref:LysO family transporter n=1 Tax=Anaeroselena agilis TaxID=3063788 RepID=A0ABU3P1N2_9FIRM|nr:LysO family transporter [Selenomonadales bacterium 4137-cl]